MRRLILVVVTACGARSAPHETAIRNTVETPKPPPGAPCGLDWLAEVRELRLSEVTSGLFGLTSFHVDIERRHDLPHFEGVVMAAYREYPDRDPKSIAKRVEYKLADVIDPLVAMRDGMTVPDKPFARNLIVHDSSTGIEIAIDLVDNKGRRAQFYTATGQSQPMPWLVTGCDREVSHEAKKAMTAAFEILATLVQRDAIMQGLTKTP